MKAILGIMISLSTIVFGVFNVTIAGGHSYYKIDVDRKHVGIVVASPEENWSACKTQPSPSAPDSSSLPQETATLEQYQQQLSQKYGSKQIRVTRYDYFFSHSFKQIGDLLSAELGPVAEKWCCFNVRTYGEQNRVPVLMEIRACSCDPKQNQPEIDWDNKVLLGSHAGFCVYDPVLFLGANASSLSQDGSQLTFKPLLPENWSKEYWFPFWQTTSGHLKTKGLPEVERERQTKYTCNAQLFPHDIDLSQRGAEAYLTLSLQANFSFEQTQQQVSGSGKPLKFNSVTATVSCPSSGITAREITYTLRDQGIFDSLQAVTVSEIVDDLITTTDPSVTPPQPFNSSGASGKSGCCVIQ